MADKLKTARIGHGLRERLLLSFIAISSFAVVAAAVGNYAFYAIGQSLHQVTEKSVPPAIATLELAQRTERIIAAGPALLGVTTTDEFKTASSALERELRAAERRSQVGAGSRHIRGLQPVPHPLDPDIQRIKEPYPRSAACP